jgi:hypothetical protein
MTSKMCMPRLQHQWQQLKQHVWQVLSAAVGAGAATAAAGMLPQRLQHLPLQGGLLQQMH